MRLLLICMLLLIAGSGPVPFSEAEETKSEGGGLETLLRDYLQKRLQQAQLAYESLTRQKEEGIVTLPQVLAAEDEVDRWRLHLILLTEGRLISNHPVIKEIRSEYGVPEITQVEKDQDARLVSSAVQDYLRKRLERAERLLGSATLLHEMGRATESDVLEARSRVDGLKLLLEVERRNPPIVKEQQLK
jgi:hypothetical protein